MRRFVIGSMLLAWATAAPASAEPAYYFTNYSGHWQQSLEVWVPDGPCPTYPLVIFIHGGGWVSGDSAEVGSYLQMLLDRGFAVASINYRWASNGTFPAQIHDVKGAVRFLRANAQAYSIDPDRFAVFGDSAGGHLAALLATSSGVTALEGNVGGNLGFSSAVQAAGDFYGPTDLFAWAEINNGPDGEISQLFGIWIQQVIDNMDDPDYADIVVLIHSANPVTHVTADDPPIYIAHGNDDTYVPPSQSQVLFDALVKAGVPTTLVLVPGFGHELPTWEYEPAFDLFGDVLGLASGPADIDCDLAVNVNDLLVVINQWGSCPPAACAADVNDDGVVSVDDLLLVINGWG